LAINFRYESGGGGEQLSILLHSCLLFTRKEGKKKNLMQTNKKYANLPRKKKILILKVTR
jgi:hypothetical protein